MSPDRKVAALRKLRDEMQERLAHDAEVALSGRACELCVYYSDELCGCSYSPDGQLVRIDKGLVACEHFFQNGAIRSMFRGGP
jgi:hypothetical protein